MGPSCGSPVLLLALLAACGDDLSPPAPAEDPLPEVDDPLDWIDPTIGSGGLGFGYGACFVGAAVPHGLAKVGPDTKGPFGTVPFQHFSGYYAEDDLVQAFTHLHLHGAGVADLGVLAIMPTLAFDPARRGAAYYEARFAKADELARPGAYRVRLAAGADGPDDDIAVELIATAHGAHEIFDFAGADGTLVLDLAKALSGDVTDAELHLDAAAGTGWGAFHHAGNMSGAYGGYRVHFAFRTRAPWTAHRTWADGEPTDAASASGTAVGAALTFAAGAPVELQLALSLVDVDGARANLAAELPAWDAAATRAAADDAWRAVTGTVRVTGGSPAQRRTFYTSLYHAFLMPTVISDVDGRYRLAGIAEPFVASGPQLSDLSLWDTYRTVHPLYAWLAPASAADAARSLIRFADGLGAFPRWPIATGESATMLGAPAEIVLADAIARGVDVRAEVEAAWPRLRAAALDAVAPIGGRGGREHVEPYMAHGYAPMDLVGRSVSVTTEYAHADFALAGLARALGADDDAARLDERRLGWRALYDPEVGFLRGRASDGRFGDPAAFHPTDALPEYAEANAWQSMWMAGVHDPDGMIEILGGPGAVVAKLDEMFAATVTDRETSTLLPGLAPPPYYWHGNEPDLNAGFLYAQVGRPDLTQRWTRWIVDTLYGDAPDGVAGNDDGGTLGAWYVWAAMGLYPVAGSERLVVGAPLFPSARVTVGGRQLIIEAPGAPVLTHVAGLSLDGVPVDTPELDHADLAAASTLTFELSATPTSWGRR